VSGLTSRVDTPRPGPNGRGLGVIRAIRVDEQTWAAAGDACELLGTNRAEVARQALVDVIEEAAHERARMAAVADLQHADTTGLDVTEERARQLLGLPPA